MMATGSRRKIHTSVKFLAYIHALPDEYARHIHPSMRSRYQNSFDVKEYFGYELSEIELKSIEHLRLMNLHEADRKLVSACLEVTQTVRGIFSEAKRYLSTLRKNKDKIVNVLLRFKDILSLKKASSLLDISEYTLRAWRQEIEDRCPNSFIGKCRKKFRGQLMFQNIEKIRKMLLDEACRFWSLRSLYYHALRENLVSISLSTWYRYVRKLNIKRQKPISLKKYGKSVVATKPNEYWHADVMYFKTKDGKTSYLYTVMDNYSRFPLLTLTSRELSGHIRKETIRQALRVALTIHPNTETIKLVVDGGSENFNGTVNEYLNSLKNIDISRVRALADVPFSNSMAEALNRTFRCDYLNQMPNNNHSAFERNVDFIRTDFAFKRPHGVFKGLTPFEMYSGKMRPEDVSWKKQIAQDLEERRKLNQASACPACPKV